MVGDGETMRFVTHPLQQIHAFGLSLEDDRIVVIRHPNLLKTLRQSATATSSAVGKRLGRRHHLRFAAIDYDQIRLIGEMATVGVLLHGIRFRTIRAIRPIILRGHPTLVVHAFPGIAGDVASGGNDGSTSHTMRSNHPTRPARPHLGWRNGGTRLFRDRVFEHHHGRYLERAADCVEMS